jgi:RES domain-containing protein
VRVWRICSEPHASSALTGIGGLYAAGRWHHKGHPIVYTSATPSLAALEVLVHVDPALAPDNMRLLEIDVPVDIAVEVCDPEQIVADWSVYPAPSELQEFGSQWLASLRSAVLRVPAAVMPVESNFLLNPRHAQFNSVRVIQDLPFSFDSRLLVRNE